ncbi:MAG TPA: type II secretion system F family protein [Acidimicrobiales bacterium]|nr:type II secretion system F family protein [Acidimicrobiales bacterium]
MNTTVLVGALGLAGLGLLGAGWMTRVRSREVRLAELLQLPYGEQDVDVARVAAEYGTVVTGTLGLAERAIKQAGSATSLRTRIERADLSVRPSELVVIAACLGFAVGLAATAWTGRWWAVVLVVLITPAATSKLLDLLASRRNKRFAQQLPEALVLISSSLSAGHTFLRSIQLLATEAESPLSDELRRVVSETQLGTSLVDSLEHLSTRVRNRDLEWMVQAIRIQQQTGGHLTDLMATLAEVIRGREEVRREISVLTAEGRISAWILGLMPVALFLVVESVNPGYLDPMLQGWGLVFLALTALSMAAGVAIILKLVRSVEL